MIDLCPVGALTSKPYAFVARPWELEKTESIDVFDAVGSNIRVDSRGSEVLRALPRINDDVNEEWISDKSRFAVDGLRRQRLDQPYVRTDGKLRPATWPEAFTVIARKLDGVDGARIAALAGDLADCESMYALKDLMILRDSPHFDCRQDGAKVGGARVGYLFNTTIAGIEEADAALLIGTNPRHEAPVLNARIRKRYMHGKFPIGVIGPAADLTYKYTHIGPGPEEINAIATGSHEFCKVLEVSERPMLIVGSGALARSDGAAILAQARAVAETYGMVSSEWKGFNVLHRVASRVGGLDLGFVPGKDGLDTAGIVEAARTGAIEVLYLLGADEIDTTKLGNTFVIYQGHHGDAGAHRADVILPGAAYTEKNGTYVNTEGRVQRAALAHFPPGEAREDWKILRALSEVLGRKLAYDDLETLRSRMAETNPVFAAIDAVVPSEWAPFGQAGALDPAPFVYPIESFYMTDPISRASETMAQCRAAAEGEATRTGTDG
jgi:NADH-quinone oxidoreductase subunit G